MQNKGEFFEEDKTESSFNMGQPYLIGVANQMNIIRVAERDAFRYKGDAILFWLTELRCFHDLVHSQLRIRNSTKEIELFEYKMENNKLVRIKRMVKEPDLFIEWFSEIEKMYEKITIIKDIGEMTNYLKYKKYKAILLELSEVTRELYHYADKRKLIMPNVKMNMKDLAKSEWIDRDFKKEF